MAVVQGARSLEGHNLQAMNAVSRRVEPNLAHCQTAMSDDCFPIRFRDHRRSLLGYFLFGRCVRADAAAVFAAALDFGLRRTLAAALAAFLLVTSLFDRDLAMIFFYCLCRAALTRIDDKDRKYTHIADMSIYFLSVFILRDESDGGQAGNIEVGRRATP